MLCPASTQENQQLKSAEQEKKKNSRRRIGSVRELCHGGDVVPSKQAHLGQADVVVV